MRLYLSFVILALPSLCLADDAQVKFSTDIAPILVKNCSECHGAGKAKGKFRIDTFERLKQPGDSGKEPLVAGKPQSSELYRLLTTPDEDDRMPKKADRLPRAQIETIRKWIAAGATFDGNNPATPLVSLVPRTESGPPDVYSRPVPITALAYIAGGKYLAASGYHEITVWNAHDGKLASRIRSLPERTWSIAISPDGKSLAAASGEPGVLGELRVYSLGENAVVSQPRVLERIGDMMLTVRFSPDGKTLVAGGADNAIRVYDLQTWQKKLSIEQHADWVTDLAFSPDGKDLASASRDKSARVFDLATGSMESAYLGHSDAVLAVVWAADGKQLFTAGQDRAIHVWEKAKPDKSLAKMPVNEGDVYKLAIQGETLLACCTDHTLRGYSVKTRALAWKSPTADWPYALAISPTGSEVAVGNYDGEVEVFQTSKRALQFLAAPGKGGR
jgi:WD40 repeat protein